MRINSQKILISCSGLGMGNASRMYAVIEAILRQQPEADIHIYCWGNGFQFLRESKAEKKIRFSLFELFKYSWDKQRFIFSIINNFYSFICNTIILWRAVRNFSPMVIILDSDYHFPAFVFSRKKVFYLSQAMDVIIRARKLGFRSKSWPEFLSFWLGEVCDAFLQRIIAHRLLVPSFDPSAFTRDTGILPVPLVVREQFMHANKSTQSSDTVMIPGGSKIQLEKIVQVSGVSSAIPTARPSRVDDFSSDQIVVQGGLSTISECIALGRRMLVVPIEGRAEQVINAETVEYLGLGVRWRGKIQDHRNEEERATVAFNGAQIIAQRVLHGSYI